MKVLWIILVVAVGMLLPAQAAINARLKEHLGLPTYASLVSFSVGAAVLALFSLIAVGTGARGQWSNAGQAPWWAWTGGLIGAGFVTIALLAVPRLGASVLVVGVLVGQISASVVMDHFGWLGVPQHPITPARIVSVILLVVALYLFNSK
jgi:transporter family-2 protein